jgi:hypothetical protein
MKFKITHKPASMITVTITGNILGCMLNISLIHSDITYINSHACMSGYCRATWMDIWNEIELFKLPWLCLEFTLKLSCDYFSNQAKHKSLISFSLSILFFFHVLMSCLVIRCYSYWLSTRACLSAFVVALTRYTDLCISSDCKNRAPLRPGMACLHSLLKWVHFHSYSSNSWM